MHSHDLRWHVDETGYYQARCRNCGVDGALAVSVKCPHSRPQDTAHRVIVWLVFAVAVVVGSVLYLVGCWK